MAIRSAETTTSYKTNSSLQIDSSVQLHLLPNAELSPLLDPQRQPFFSALKAVAREERRHLILTFPHSQEPVTHRQLAQAGLSDSFTTAAPGSEVWRLIRTHFSEYISSDTSLKRGKETHHLTEKGMRLRSIAAFADEFTHRYPVSLEVLGQRKNDAFPSEAIRSEALFELALGATDALALTKAIKCDQSSFSRILSSFEKAGLIVIDRHWRNTFHPVELTPLGKHFITNLLIPIAEMTDYPQGRLDHIKESIGITLPPYIAELKDLTTQTNTERQMVIGRIYPFLQTPQDEGLLTVIHLGQPLEEFTPFAQGILLMKYALDQAKLPLTLSTTEGKVFVDDLHHPEKARTKAMRIVANFKDNKSLFTACQELANAHFTLPEAMPNAGERIKQQLHRSRQDFLYGMAVAYYYSNPEQESRVRRVS